MVQRTEVLVILEDDIDGGKGDETIQFGFNGATYEIDLSTKNAKKFRDAMKPYLEAGREVSRNRKSSSGSPSKGGARRRNRSTAGSAPTSDSKAIREWATANGVDVPRTGRIPSAVREAYAAAQ